MYQYILKKNIAHHLDIPINSIELYAGEQKIDNSEFLHTLPLLVEMYSNDEELLLEIKKELDIDIN